MNTVALHRPAFRELAFRKELLGDPETMAFNHAYGGAVPFPEERWESWYDRWVERAEDRFYRYLWEPSAHRFVGEVSYHYDPQAGAFLCDVLVLAACRGRGYGRQGLELLCGAARSNGVRRLRDNIAVDNPSVALFCAAGFRERFRNEEYILVEREL